MSLSPIDLSLSNQYTHPQARLKNKLMYTIELFAFE